MTATPKSTPKVGEIYRDTHADKDRRNLRTIKIVELYPNGVCAEVLTGVDGRPPAKLRATSLTLGTLRAGYELVEAKPDFPLDPADTELPR